MSNTTRTRRPWEHFSFNATIAVLSASAILFVGIGYSNSFGVFQNYYETELLPSEPTEKLITIGSSAASLYFILGAAAGRFTDLAGHRLATSLGSVLIVSSLFVASVSTKYWQLLCSQGFMFGLGVAFIYPSATTIPRQYFEPQRRGFVNGIVVSGGALGGCVLPAVIDRMVTSYGLRSTFRILGYMAGGILIPSAFILRPKRQAYDARHQRGPILDIRLLRDGRFLTLAAACTIAMAGFLPRYFLIPSSATSKGIDTAYASWLLGIMNGTSIIGRVGVGLLADHVGPTRTLATTFVLCAVGHFAFWLPGVIARADNTGQPTALLTVFVLFVGIFGSGFISLFPVVVAHLFGEDELASKTGLLNTAVGLSTFAGPSAVYAIIGDGSRTRWTAGILTTGLFMLVGGLMLGTTTVSANGPSRKQGQSTRRS